MSACLCIGALLVSYSIVSGTGRLMHASKDNPVLHHQISVGYLASNILLLLICAYYSGRRQPNPSAAGVIYMGFSGVWMMSATIWNIMSCDYVFSDTIFGLSVPVLLTLQHISKVLFAFNGLVVSGSSICGPFSWCMFYQSNEFDFKCNN
mmetsp:Transcript_2220/g.3261  ORF Transcript_2220/g.3261 Transcript_2220/m.3261 type:complete len:150 (-) Transcript_2220:261-710(-)